MASIDENILKAAKEIVVKFIECGRLSPNAFPEAFQSIYRTVEDTVKSSIKPAQTPPAPPPEVKHTGARAEAHRRATLSPARQWASAQLLPTATFTLSGTLSSQMLP